MQDIHIKPFISYYDLEIPILLRENINIYNLKFDLDFEFGSNFDLENSADKIEIMCELRNFNNIVINYYLYPNYTEPNLFKTKFKLKDLIYTNLTEQKFSFRFYFRYTDISRGTIYLKSFNYSVKDFLTNEIYNKYSEPMLLYSYNSSIKGTIQNQDKNAVHIYLNDKFKNILIILNQNIPFNYDWKSLNNIDMFGVNYGIYQSKTSGELYYELFPISDNEIKNYNSKNVEKINITKYNPDNIVASNFIKTINNINDIITLDTNIYYHYIDENGNYASTMMTNFDKTSTFNQLPNWINKFPPYLLKSTTSETLLMYEKPYNVEIYNGPSKNLKDQYLINKNGVPNKDKLINEVFATKIVTNPVNKKNGYKNKINRYSGYYEPLIRNIPMFTPTYYWVEETEENNNIVKLYKSYKGNYKFHTDLEDFGVIKEVMYSKVNEDKYILKLKDVSELSLYPILDEVGLSQTNRNIFSSPWDKDYYLRTTSNFIVSDNSYSEEIKESVVLEGGIISDIKIILPSGKKYYKGINIYGKNLSSNEKLKYSFNIKNTSSTIKDLKYVIKYQSSQKTYVVKTSTILDLNPDQVSNIILDIERPEEIKTTLNYEEFTKWYFVVELYDGITNELYDFDSSIMFSVYNDIIDFYLYNYTSTNGYNNNYPYYVQQKYNFGITFKELYNKLKNIRYDINLLMETGEETGEYYKLKTYTDYINKSTNEYIIDFNDIIIPINNLDYDNIEYRNIKFEVIHNYDIEGITQNIKYMVEKLNILVNRPQESPLLKFMGSPTLVSGAGSCFLGSYTGDIFRGGVKIVNLGGKFNGTIKVIFSLRENGTSIITKSITIDKTLDKGENTGTLFEDIEFGPIKSNGETLISYSYKDYDLKVSTSYISGYVHSDYQPGLNDTTPICS